MSKRLRPAPAGSSLTITSIEPVRGHVLRFYFSDGHSNEVDFKPWIASLPTEEEQAYLKPARFKQYSNHLGHAIMWGEYDIIFPLEAAYHGDPDLLAEGVPVHAPTRNSKQVVSRKPAILRASGVKGPTTRSVRKVKA